jgi:type 1 fimbriae regulatory protein FimB/type 1 fimbriae regulatory protein FimE
MTTAGFGERLSRIGSHSSLTFSVHPHMLRHGCGYKLVNNGHDTRSIQRYLGHKNI